MRSSVLASLALAGGLFAAGCSSGSAGSEPASTETGNAVDPAYLQAVEDMSKATCDCVGKPDATVCGPKAFASKPKTPTGEPSTVYEKTLKESDQKKLNVARGKGMQCIITITRDARAAGAGSSGPLTSPATASPATASPSGSTP